ncbi:hypothetical protein K7X08_026853 [Anisodus acutangulus]|uniref:Peptidase A1 domain-containing protein n=1 Tax=Anisodus acutangulus TaxID=402998 RepID=A0A9Q1LCK2_9SOLA|nr:hypothetical protein K7X08_026853 [Anisodus acutangulus]
MVFVLFLVLQLHKAFGTFGFDIHHRYSDPVKGTISDLHWLPQKGSIQYYSAWTQHDRHINRHRYTSTVGLTPNHRRLTSTVDLILLLLTFDRGNRTVLLSSLGFLHYAYVTVDTPGLSFLVALDTGSDLFWLPCNCNNCARTLITGSGRPIDLNIYSPNTSSISKIVPCNGTLACGYGVASLSNNTSSSGVLVEDILHLQTGSTQQKVVEAPITLGCGMKQTGAFLNGAAPNGLFGLGMGNISVPSILASKGLAANSFSMCFGADGIGRIDFGDKGSPGQGETPFNLKEPHQTYNISLTGITVGNKETDVDFTAIFDSGTSFTYLNDPAYKVITENFNSQAQEQHVQPTIPIPFEYCYGLRANQTSFKIRDVNLIMKGGNQVYCLAVVKSGDVNIIGQNFMTGYWVVFDREKMVLGWKPSDCECIFLL